MVTAGPQELGIELLKGGAHLARFLIQDPIGCQTPTAAAGQARITAGHQVVQDAPRAQLHGRISQVTEPLAIATDQGCLQQGRQAFDRLLVGGSAIAAHQGFRVTEATQLIETPGQTPRSEGGRSGDPTEQTMDRWMHPGQTAGTVVLSLITAHTPAQEITEQQLIGKGQGSNAQLRI